MLDCSGAYATEGFPEFDCVVVACGDEDDAALVVLRHGHGAQVAGGVVFGGPIVGVSRRPASHRCLLRISLDVPRSVTGYLVRPAIDSSSRK
jgi:hypothetical protein